jgi:hypothetical protein
MSTINGFSWKLHIEYEFLVYIIWCSTNYSITPKLEVYGLEISALPAFSE